MAGDEQGWVNRACDLEAAGDQAGARALFVANTTLAERRKMRHAAARFRRWRTSPNIAKALTETSEITASLRAARALPADEKLRRAWEAVGTMLPRDALDLYRYLRRPAKRGRPKGPGSVVCDIDLLSQMEANMSGPAAMGPTKAARAALVAAGVLASQIKSRADYMVRLHRANNSS